MPRDRISASRFCRGLFVSLTAALLLGACGDSSRPNFTVGGTVTGLVGKGLVLQNNLGDDLAVSSDGQFAFSTALESGSEYVVTVSAQPTSPSQTCRIAKYTGTIARGEVTDVAVACTTNTYAVGGTVSGLAGSGLVLQDNLGNDLGVTSNGAFTFGAPVASGSTYSVSVKTQPSSPRQTCTVSSGDGAVVSDAITSVSITCINTYSLGGIVSGLTLGGLVLAAPGQRDLPVDVGATTFSFPTTLPAGSNYAVRVKTQPAAEVCTVLNDSGVFGAADVANVIVRCVRLWSAVAAGYAHTAAITIDRTLWAWGWNHYGQLGDGTTVDRSSPVQVGSGFAAVAAGGFHTVTVKTDGTLWAWGWNQRGQLGDGTTVDRSSPVQVGSGFAAVDAGYAHTVAVKTDGTLWAWGSNLLGQLGDGTTVDRFSPVQVGSGFAAVAVGNYHTVAVKTDGTLWAWGYNAFGQLGDGTTTNRYSPVQVGSGFASVATGGNHTVAVKTDGTLWAWGWNGHAQLGDGTTTDQSRPMQVGSEFAAVSAGGSHTLALKMDGTLWAWGDNSDGQLGAGTSAQYLLPIQIP